MNKKVLLTAVLEALLCIGCIHNEKGGNLLKTCIFPGDYPDPSIIRDGNDFYMTHSSFTYYPGLLIWHSTDLLTWEPIARAVQGQDYSIFAPDLCKVGDRYYIYYPTSNGLNFVVTADSIQGPWSEPILIDVNGIDPGHVVDSDGNRYLYTNNGHVIPLTADGLHAAGPNRKVYDGWQYPQEWETEGMWLESPKLCKRGEWFYLVSAEGGTAGPVTSHMCVVARSRSAVGPWENSPYNPMIHTYSADEAWWSKGHGTLIDDADGNWYIVYHAYRNNFHTLGRSTMIESVVWTEDGWPVAAQKDGSLWQDNGLQADYGYLRDYDNPLMWAKWEPRKDVTIMTTTAIDQSYSIEAQFSIAEGGKAGLYLFYNDDACFGADVTDSVPDIRIRIENRENTASVWTSTDGSVWKLIEADRNLSDYHHNTYKGFFALRPAYMTTPGAELVSFTYNPL